MKFTLEIEPRVKHPYVISTLLEQAAYTVRAGHGDGVVYFEGNTVGKWEVTETTRMPEQTDRITCPRCASANVVVCPDWEARSLDPTDRENTATLTEYQCRACEGVSFWIGTEKPAPAETPAKPQASEPYRVERVRLFTDRVFGECAEIIPPGESPFELEPGATNVRLAWGIYQRQPDGTDKHVIDMGRREEANHVCELLNARP